MTKPFYKYTNVGYLRSKEETERLLEKHGCVSIDWVPFENSIPGLFFIKQVEIKGVVRSLLFYVPPLVISSGRYRVMERGERRIVRSPNFRASMRSLHWYLKAKLETVELGRESFVAEFFSYIAKKLPDGSVIRMGDKIEEWKTEEWEINETLSLDDGKRLISVVGEQE